MIDETGLTGRYDFDLSWQKGDLKSLQNAPHDQLEFALTNGIRNRELLVVTSAVKPKTW